MPDGCHRSPRHVVRCASLAGEARNPEERRRPAHAALVFDVYRLLLLTHTTVILRYGVCPGGAVTPSSPPSSVVAVAVAVAAVAVVVTVVSLHTSQRLLRDSADGSGQASAFV